MHILKYLHSSMTNKIVPISLGYYLSQQHSVVVLVLIASLPHESAVRSCMSFLSNP